MPHDLKSDRNRKNGPELLKTPKLPLILLVLLMATYSAVFLYLTYQRYTYLEFYIANDTATNMQTVWSMVHGSFFTSSINIYLKPVAHNVLGDQLYFTLVLYLPFWLVSDSPFSFVVVTVAAAALSAVPLFYLARDRLDCSWIGLIVCASFLFNPISYETYVLFGFRPETLFMPFVLAAFLFIWREKYLSALPFIILVMLTKHNSLLITCGLGAYLLFQPGKARRFGVLIILLSALYFFAVVQPLFSRFTYSPIAISKQLMVFGPDPASALKNLLLHPGLYFDQVSVHELKFLALALLPVGFLCFLSPVFYICVPIILYNLLYKEYGSIHCGWHWSLVAPFVYIGAVDAIARIRSRWKEKYARALVVAGLIIVSIGFLHEADKLAEHFSYQEGFYYRRNHVDTKKMFEALELIEPNASVVASLRILWPLSFREKVYYCPDRFHYYTDYVVITKPVNLGYKSKEDSLDMYLVMELENPESILYTNYYTAFSNENLVILKLRDYR